MDCGKGLSDDDDSGKANGLEEYLQRDLKLWDSDGWGATTISIALDQFPAASELCMSSWDLFRGQCRTGRPG